MSCLMSCLAANRNCVIGRVKLFCAKWQDCIAFKCEPGFGNVLLRIEKRRNLRKMKQTLVYTLKFNHELSISNQFSFFKCDTTLHPPLRTLKSKIMASVSPQQQSFPANWIKKAQAWLPLNSCLNSTLQIVCEPSLRSTAEPLPPTQLPQAREALPHQYLQMRISLLLLIGAGGGRCGWFTSGRWGGTMRQCTPADLRV